MSVPLMPGAEPISIEGTRGGVLLLHGYTGTPQQIRPWAEGFARAGFAVEAPLLPGHGTIPEEMIATQWSDYVGAAEASYRKLAEHHQQVFVGGLCLGGNIATWLALQHPAATAGLMVINGHFKPPRGKSPETVLELLRNDKQFFVWATLPKQVEDPSAPSVLAYTKVPIAPMRSLEPARIEICQRFGEIRCPVLVFTSLLSPKDDQDVTWFEQVSGPVEHVLLARSNSIATLDYDRDIIEARSLAFVQAVSRGDLAHLHAQAILPASANASQRQEEPELYFSEQDQLAVE